MHSRYFSVLLLSAVLALPGCSLPRGPIDIAPFVPRWISHGELGGDCPPEAPMPVPAQTGLAHPPAVEPPHIKFHPVPTRPVFEPPARNPI